MIIITNIFFRGSNVAKRISKGTIEPSMYSEEPLIFALCMLGVLAGYATTILGATVIYKYLLESPGCLTNHFPTMVHVLGRRI